MATFVNLLRNLAWGLGWSLAMAAMFCVWASIVAVLNGGRLQFKNFDTTLGEVVLAYLLAGAIAGIILGACRPFLKRREATWWVSGVIGVAAFGAIGTSMMGPPTTWDSVIIAAVIAIGASGGVALGDHIYKEQHKKDKPAA